MRQKIEEIYRVIDQNYSFCKDIGLLSGKGGIVLFLFYYYKLTLNTKAYDLGSYLIEAILAEINQRETLLDFCHGIAGIGWLIEHLEQNEFLECDTNDLLSGIDEYIYKSAIIDLQNKDYDFLHAAIGKGLYLLKRKKVNESYLEEIAKLMLKISESPLEGQLRWPSPHPLNQRMYNISLSHGIAGIINFFTRLIELDTVKSEAQAIVNKSINYLLTLKFENQISIFPNNHILEKHKYLPSRLAWCYGDLGIGITLWQVSQSLDDKFLEKNAMQIMLHSTRRRDLKDNRVIDAGLCHGTSGIAHIFNRMFINTGLQEFEESSDYWFNETLKMARFSDGLAGYKSWQGRNNGWYKEINFLEGIAGVGLALISKVSDIMPQWDECLLLS